MVFMILACNQVFSQNTKAKALYEKNLTYIAAKSRYMLNFQLF